MKTLPAITGRFTTITFTKVRPANQEMVAGEFYNSEALKCVVTIKSTKTGGTKTMYITDDGEWDRRRFAWLLMYNPNVKPSEIVPFSALRWAHEMRNSIQEDAINRAHAKMVELYGWGNPADEHWNDVCEEWADEYYAKFGPIRDAIAQQLVNNVRAA